MGPDAMIFIFWMLSFKPAFHSPLIPSSRDTLFPLHFMPLKWYHLHIWGCWYFSGAILIPACPSSSLAFHMMFSACKLNMQGYNTALMYSFPNLEPVYYSMSNSSCCFLTCIQVSQKASKVVWYFHLLKNFPPFAVKHTVKGFSRVNEADVFLELSCFFYDSKDVGNLIPGSSAFSKSNLNLWKFMVHILLKSNLENFEHYFASVWDECNCVVVWAFFGIALLAFTICFF